MKLYDMPRGSKIRLNIVGQDQPEDGRLQVCTFNHVDGMYSHITTENGSTVHLGASTDVVCGADGIYEIAKPNGQD